MQTLWTRVAQVRSACSCPQCASAVHGISRQAGTTASRRVPRYWTSSTLWYSGIFATAASFDAVIKNQRREKWDLAIADVKQELDQQEQRLVGQADSQAADAAEPAQKYQPFSSNEWKELYANVDSSVGRAQKPIWPTNTGAQLKLAHLPPQSIFARDWQKNKEVSTRWGQKKLERLSLSVDILQLKLFMKLSEQGKTEEAASEVPDSYATLMRLPRNDLHDLFRWKREDLQRLGAIDGNHVDEHGFQRSANDVPLSNYHQDDRGDYRAGARHMNHTLQGLFREAHKGAQPLAALLAKVYFTIGSSPAPPNVDTYNILLANLSHLRKHDIVEDVIMSFEHVRLRHNEVTLAAMLNHYRITSNADRFRDLVLRMRGKKGGLMAARPDIRITDAGRSRLVENERNGRVLQLPYATPMVFGALVKGVLHFSGFEKALQLCSKMSEEGWGLDMDGMTPLLQDCAQRGDWESGWAVWQRIQVLKWKDTRRHHHGRKHQDVTKPQTYISMLQLCSRAKRQDIFDQVLHQVDLLRRDLRKEVFDFLESGRQCMEDTDPVRAAVTAESAIEDERVAPKRNSPNVAPSPRTVVKIVSLENGNEPLAENSKSTTQATVSRPSETKEPDRRREKTKPDATNKETTHTSKRILQRETKFYDLQAQSSRLDAYKQEQRATLTA